MYIFYSKNILKIREKKEYPKFGLQKKISIPSFQILDLKKKLTDILFSLQKM